MSKDLKRLMDLNKMIEEVLNDGTTFLELIWKGLIEEDEDFQDELINDYTIKKQLGWIRKDK